MLDAATDSEFDPNTVAISPAATVMVIADSPTLRVLMVRRTGRVVFAPDAWVFPGGRVDPADAEGTDVVRRPSDRAASAALGLESGGLAWWLAAARETLEEAGLLLGVAADPPDLASMRAEVRSDEGRFVPLLRSSGITLDLSGVWEVARFITPVGSPRRFDARFFVALAPEAQEPDHDDGEIVDWEWVTPADALARWHRGEMEMISPTVRMVQCLERFDSAADVIAVARQQLDYQRVRVSDPAGDYRVLLPGEDGYETADLQVESGWVRLWPTPGASSDA